MIDKNEENGFNLRSRSDPLYLMLSQIGKSGFVKGKLDEVFLDFFWQR